MLTTIYKWLQTTNRHKHKISNTIAANNATTITTTTTTTTSTTTTNRTPIKTIIVLTGAVNVCPDLKNSTLPPTPFYYGTGIGTNSNINMNIDNGTDTDTGTDTSFGFSTI
uniref:Uncharacterized protein n=1 Tax=Glossina austeni TaxID=7395 RepID=A0A1A9UMA0_GLOAU